ncbi:Prospero homeobox protein 1 Homeobox prospero-like protein PROX1 [Larimichthys crocea]|uniref:Prospero homeobox protein 1 Homeobox prospero-like protein PROX1 n=1 Tax=Larimichthys crocea TaxID=215358 RepID=A0A6G0HJ52_LARCR|nr:Prospero homeobox protein 1 Homeobox prospero-like protein PROX1 [Larimichthys crocea]
MMDSPTDLFGDSASQIHAFAPTHSSTDLPGVHPQPSAGRPPPAFRPPGFPLIHHLLQPGGTPRRIGGQVNTSLSTHRHLEDRNLEEDRGERGGQVEQGIEEGEEGVLEGDDGLLGVKKRHGDAALAAEWGQDVLKVKRMKLESRPRDGEAEEGGRRRQGGREGKRREREELKEQLEEARERLQALQEKVWRAFGEKHMAEEEEERKKRRGSNRGGRDGGDGDVGMMEEEEDITEGMYDEDDIDGGEMEKETFSLLSVSPFDNFHKRREERQKDREGRMERGTGGGLHLEGVMEGAGLWLDCGGLMRGDWHGGIEDEGEEGGQKFAQALKLELGSAVARVIDRVLRLYTEMTDFAPSSPPTAISFLPSDAGNDGGRERGVWMGLLTRGRGEEKVRGKEEKMGAQDGEREKQLQKMSNGSALPPGQPHRTEASDLAMPLAVQRSADIRKAHPLLGPPLSTHLNPSHPNLSLHHPSLPRPPPLSHPPLLPAASQPKDPSSASFHPSSSSSSSSTSSFPAPPPPPPPPPPPLPLPLLHYSMQQLFSRSLHHPQLPHLTPSRKDYLNSDPFLEFSSHPSAHPSFPPLPLLGHLDPSLVRHAHGGRERERGMRGDSGMRGGGGMDGGELYLTGGTQEGLSPCHLKKAKLMFFYARYPSSNTLKTYFPDVKFNRCVTSQMIKWFSNFREFFYIQMERFARQAVREALAREGTPRLGREAQLRVGRDTELYRILNMHYNKSNVYQVPERFIEISEVALREFYSAIWTGRDSDPCWKKGIYKIVCKLDSPVPDAFRLPGCPVG